MANVNSPRWAREMYNKIWDQGQPLKEQLIYNVVVTADDFERLQDRLQCSQHDTATHNVLDIKMEFIDASRAFDNTIEANDTSGDLISFPAAFTVLDLRSLHLSELPFGLSQPVILIRDEYISFEHKLLSRTFLPCDSNAFITGQSGIGKTIFLYYLLVQRLLKGQTTCFQIMEGELLIFDSHGVRQGLKRFSHPDPDIWALVDGDAENGEVFYSHGVHNVRIVMASLPKPKGTCRWVERSVAAEWIMYPWSWKELFVAAQFLYPFNVTPERLRCSVRDFGHSPLVCFEAARGDNYYDLAASRVKDAIAAMHIKTAMRKILEVWAGWDDLHGIFEILPRDDSRLFGECIVRPVSNWACRELMKHARYSREDGVLGLYQELKPWTDIVDEVVVRIWANGVHNHLQSAGSAGNAVSVRALDGGPKAVFHINIQTDSVEIGQPFQAGWAMHDLGVDSIRSWNGDFIGTASVESQQDETFIYFHPTNEVNVINVERLQGWLETRPLPSSLQPAAGRPWSIISIVPAPTLRESCTRALQPPPTFPKTSATDWKNKPRQFVLELDRREIFCTEGGKEA